MPIIDRTPIEEEPEMDISREDDIQTTSDMTEMDANIIQIPEDSASPGMS